MNDAPGPEIVGLNFDLGTLHLDLGQGLDGLTEAPPDPEPEPPSGMLEHDLDQQGRQRDRSRGGRPTLYTTPRVLAIIGALFGGASRTEAARRAGVGVSTFYVWLQLGRAGHPTFAPLAEAVASVEDARGLNVAFGQVISRRSFWNAFH